MLRITIQETGEAAVIKLEGRIAGPWVDELKRVWVETVPQLVSKKLSLDLCNVTYADDTGTRVLGGIYAQTAARLVTSTPWTQYLAEEVMRSSTQPIDKES